ncbi:MAG: HEAT repeat domain-containing protein [Chloroflexi bacterium]|nr:HEAT repeat domain-containing protein [Chloroflexota bacterium]
MSQLPPPSAEQIRQSLLLIRSSNPLERMRAIEMLSAVRDDPRVVQVFEHLYREDTDPRVREAARKAMQSAEASVPAPGTDEAPPLPGRARTPAATNGLPPMPGRASTRPAQQRPVPAPQARRRRPAARRGMFLLNPANARLVAKEMKRAARRKQDGRSALLLAMAFFPVIGLLWGIVAPDWYTWLLLERDGQETIGEVIEGQASSEDHYSLLYRFPIGPADGALTYTNHQQVTRPTYEGFTSGTPITVTYLPDDPAVSRLDTANPAHEQRNRLTIAAAGLTGITVLVLLLGSLQRSRPYLLRGGWRLLKGQLVACQGRLDDDGDYKLALRYRFRTPSGRVITGQIRQIRNDLKGRALPRPGTPLAVYYRNVKTHRLL